MTRSRQFRFVAALIALIGMLYTQLAMASYVCPEIHVRQASAMANMPGCAGMDMEQPNLCHAHSQVGNQSLDKPDVPAVPPFMAVGLALPLISVELAVSQPQAYFASDLLTRTTAPPLSIRNCCFRI